MLGPCWLHSAGGSTAQRLELSVLASLQEGDEMPQDWRSLFDTNLFSMDTRLVPQVSKMQLKVVRRNGCTLSPALQSRSMQWGSTWAHRCALMLSMIAVGENAEPPSRTSTALQLRCRR